MNSIVAGVTTMLLEHPDIDANQMMIVNFNKFNASSVDFIVYTFTKTTDWIDFHRIKQDVLLKIASIVAAHNAEIAFPTSTIHLESPLALGSTQ
jgi:MscS family membrane protein